MSDDELMALERDAARRGICPIYLLDDFYTEHWDTDSLCSFFSCASCVGSPYDEWLEDLRKELGDDPGPAQDYAHEPLGDIPF